MSRALNVLALAFALALAGCSSTSERTRAEGFRSPRIFAGGFGAAQGGGGGNPTGYSESSGTVTLSDELNVGTAADAVATGDFAAGLTGAARIHYDQSAGSLTLYQSNGTTNASLAVSAGYLNLDAASAYAFKVGGSAKVYLTGTEVFPATAGGVALGATSAPFGSLTLGDATAQVTLGHDGATDGRLEISDPNGADEGAVFVRDRSGVYFGGIEAINGSGHVYLYSNNQARVVFSGADFYPSGAAGSYVIGSATKPFGNAFLAGQGNAASLGIKSATEVLSGLSGASASTTNLVPAGCRVLYVVARVTTTITGATTWDAGDGSDVDRYGAALALTTGTTLDEASATADPESWSASAQDVTLTANGSNFTGGAVRITAFYLDPTPPGS